MKYRRSADRRPRFTKRALREFSRSDGSRVEMAAPAWLVEGFERAPVNRSQTAVGVESAWAMGSPWLGLGGLGTVCIYAISVNTEYMCMTNRPLGRPTKKPQDRPFQMRVSEEFLRTVDDWRRGQSDLPSRAEAIRRMVELAAKMKRKPEADH